MDSLVLSPVRRAATVATAFDRREELQERLRRGPDGEAAPLAPAAAHAPPTGNAAMPAGSALAAGIPRETTEGVVPVDSGGLPVAAVATAAPTAGLCLLLGTSTTPTPAATRWTLESIRSTFDWLRDYTLSGVWRYLNRQGLKLRSARVQQFSPDPQYQEKLAEVEMALWEARRYPDSVTCVFIDEMGFSRWPDPGLEWGSQAALADRKGAKNGLWRLIGALNPLTGQVNYLDNYIVGRAKVVEFYEELVQTYPQAKQLYVIQDNWSIHSHPDVLEALKSWPQVQPVWLPTYAPWLNPIEKLWRWLKQDVLKLHRLADDWQVLRAKVRDWLEKFEAGSRRLLEYVGLLGNGMLARMIHGP
jgi:transposase